MPHQARDPHADARGLASRSAEQVEIDQQNAAFWSELCGSRMARELGLTGDEPDALARFDSHYFAFYRYLRGYVDRFDLSGRAVLEIGLGYGTLGQYIAEQGALYHGLDIAITPVELMRHRLRMLDKGGEERVLQGSALAVPWAEETFDFVYSIGCLHHTGDLQQAADEVHRVLKPDGWAIVMLYNRYSARQLWRFDSRRLLPPLISGRGQAAQEIRGHYDASVSGEIAPHTDFTSRRDARRLFRAFSGVRIEGRNFGEIHARGKVLVARDVLIRTWLLPKVLGLDLYVIARK